MKNLSETTVFANSVGTLKQNSFILHGSDAGEIEIDKIVFIEVRRQRDTTFNKIAGAGAFICLLAGLVLYWKPLLSLLGFALLCLAAFVKYRKYHLQVTYKALEVLFVKVPANKVIEADYFIINFYKHKNQRILKKHDTAKQEV